MSDKRDDDSPRHTYPAFWTKAVPVALTIIVLIIAVLIIIIVAVALGLLPGS